MKVGNNCSMGISRAVTASGQGWRLLAGANEKAMINASIVIQIVFQLR